MNPRLARAILTFPMVLLPLVVLVPLHRAAAAEGGVFFVDSTEDGIDAIPGDGLCATAGSLCTLRAAVMEANALGTADRIELGSGVYYLSITGLFEEQAATGDLDIYGTLTIVGQGMTLTGVDAGGTGMGDRAIHVHPGATFRLEGVDVINANIGMGSNGAGLRNDSGNVVIQGSSFQFSQAHNGAGLMNVGQMVVRNSLIGYNIGTDAGAGIRNDGTLEIESSTLLENEAQAGPGGAIENHGTLTIRNSTISNNRAGALGGAIYNGYGPLSTGASLTINNSTIFANLALTGGSGEPATGGIYSVEASSVQLSNSILALNGVDYSADADCLGEITSLGHNLFSSLDGCTLAGDLTGNIVSADPGLGTIIEEDPAHTASFPLLPGSPALEAGSPLQPGSSASACEPADQRGILRPQVARCDIGAREMEGTPPPSGLFFDGFETGDLSAWSSAETDQGDLRVAPEVALGGSFGLDAMIDDNRSLYVLDTTPASESAYAARFYFDPNSIAMASGNAHLLFKALDAASRSVHQIELRSYQGDYQIRAQALSDSGSATSTSWFRLHDDVHAIETIWQASSADGASDGSLTLWLDGELVASLAGLDNDTLRVESVRLGAVAGIDSGTRGSYFFDAFGSTAGAAIGPDPGITLPMPPPTPDAVFADGFESGDLSAWSAVTNGTDLSVSSSAALGGGFGLEAIVDDTAPRYVSDWSPVSLRSYASRFYFDPNSISMASGNSHVLFRALDFAAKTAFQIELRSYQGDYQIRAYAPWDSGGAYTSPWFRVSNDPHLLEAIWQAASGDGASDGWISLSIDAESVASGSGLDNDTRRVDKVDLGAVAGIDSGTSGTYYFDAFASTTGIPIGPDPGIALPTPPSPADEIFADGFESGGLSAWSTRKNEGDLLVNNGSALAGGYGLEAIADDTAPRYVTDWSPVAEKEYHVRFVFDPNSLTMLDGRSHVIFQALSGSSKVIARVELRYKSLNYELRSGVLTDANQWLNTGWWYIDDGPQVIELDWRGARFPWSPDGSLTIWINEEQAESLDGIDNSLQQVDLAQMGLVVGVDSGTLGSTRFDAFESRRWGHIGLPDDLATPVPTGTPTGTLTTTPTLTPTLTPTPDCGNIAVNSTDILYSSYVRMLVTNQNPYPIHLTDSTISWAGPGLYPGQALGGMYFDGYYWIGNDPVSPSSHAPAPPIAVSPGATAPWYGYFLNAPALFGTYSVTLTFDDTCVVSGSVNRDPPTMTVTPTPTHTKTPAGTLGPSATFTPTPVPPGTATVTATPTAGAASCELIHIERFGYAWDRMFVKVVNNNAVPVSLTGSYIEWPDSGDGYLDWLEFGARYYEGDDPEPPTSVSLSPPIALAGDSSEFWIAGFPYGVVGWPEDWWDIELEFNDVCTVSLGFSILTPTPTWLP